MWFMQIFNSSDKKLKASYRNALTELKDKCTHGPR